MASQAFIVDTGANISVSLPQNQEAKLSFSTSEVAGMRLSEDGELTISFRDGGSLTIDNFRSLAEQDVQIALEDGGALDTGALFDTLAADLMPVKLALPQDGEVVAYNIEAGRKYDIDLDEPVQSVEEQGDALLITFVDGGQLVLRNFQEAMAAENTAEIRVDDVFVSLRDFAAGIELADLVAQDRAEPVEDVVSIQPEADIRSGEEQLAQLAQQLAGIEPAAGEGAGAGARGGFGFQSVVSSAPLSSPEAIGPIGPTALAFGLPEVLDETDYTRNAPPLPPPHPGLEFDHAQVYEDGSVTLNLFAQSNTAAPTVSMTIEVSGIPAGWSVDPNGGTYDAATGTWTGVVTGDTFSGGPILSPPANSDEDIPSLSVHVVNTDSVTGLSSSVTGSLKVTTDAVADVPNLAASDSVTDEDSPADLDIMTSVADTDGSEAITSVIISNVPAGFSLTAGMETSPGVWVLDHSELAGLQINAPADYFGTITLDVTSIAEEVNKTDDDFDLTNDTASNTAQFDVTWRPPSRFLTWKLPLTP